ncbi:MAG: DNA repair exonuclease [Candidatus Thermoplasmatota archaeon]
MKFAHISDCHLGAFRDGKLRELNTKTFINAMDRCIEENVDFIIISGDLFHVNIPEMSITRTAVEKLREIKENGIKVYVIYGSHDFSAGEVSMIDVLHAAGLFEKIMEVKEGDGIPKLKIIFDKKTGAIITGISGRKTGLEKSYYEFFDFKNFEEIAGYKIFVFHTAISELKPTQIEACTPISLFPKGIDYYAGGHIHYMINTYIPNYGRIVYPGPLFASSYQDLELIANGINKCGFYIVEDGKQNFIELKEKDVELIEVNAGNRGAIEINEELKIKIDRIDMNEKIILIKLWGEVEGKIRDINTELIQKRAQEIGAYAVYVNKNSLRSADKRKVAVEAKTREELEEKIIRAHFSSKEINIFALLELLKTLKEEHKVGSKTDYENFLKKNAEKSFGIGI